jgi:hypothetical protein
MYVCRNIKARSRNHFCRGKEISIIYSECVSVAIVTQHAKRMLGIILSPVGCLAVPYCSTLSHKRQDFRKKVNEHKICVLIFSTALSEIFLILRIIKRHTVVNVQRSSCNVTVIIVGF